VLRSMYNNKDRKGYKLIILYILIIILMVVTFNINLSKE